MMILGKSTYMFTSGVILKVGHEARGPPDLVPTRDGQSLSYLDVERMTGMVRRCGSE